jgi:uroporphyrinogen-III synthase
VHPRILITRSRHQTSDLATRLEALGAETILIPTIDLAPPTTYAPLDAILSSPEAEAADQAKPDWLLFTSANAVEAFHRRALHLQQAATPPDSPKDRVPRLRGSLTAAKVGEAPQTPETHTKIAAIGPATARALTAIGLPADLIPPHAIAESLAQSLLPHITPGRTRVLLIRAETARDHLPDTLTTAGAHVTIVPAYRTVIPAESIPQLQHLFADPANWPDAITFTSSSTATNLLSLLEVATLPLPPEILRASIGPITSQTLRDLGHPPHLEATESNIPSLVQTLAGHFHLA